MLVGGHPAISHQEALTVFYNPVLRLELHSGTACAKFIEDARGS
jgi:hypothetical protein